MGMYNFVGGKSEKENVGLNGAYRELVEETNVKKCKFNIFYKFNICKMG